MAVIPDLSAALLAFINDAEVETSACIWPFSPNGRGIPPQQYEEQQRLNGATRNGVCESRQRWLALRLYHFNGSLSLSLCVSLRSLDMLLLLHTQFSALAVAAMISVVLPPS